MSKKLFSVGASRLLKTAFGSRLYLEEWELVDSLGRQKRWSGNKVYKKCCVMKAQ